MFVITTPWGGGNLSLCADVEIKFKDMVAMLGQFSSNKGDETWAIIS